MLVLTDRNKAVDADMLYRWGMYRESSIVCVMRWRICRCAQDASYRSWLSLCGLLLRCEEAEGYGLLCRRRLLPYRQGFCFDAGR